MRQHTEFSRLKSVEVTVEERRIAMEVSPDAWRTHVFTGLDAVPHMLAPSFHTEDCGQELHLLDLVSRCYQRGSRQAHHEAPYQMKSLPRSPTVLRSVDIKMQYCP
jgi:hypothetical protein